MRTFVAATLLLGASPGRRPTVSARFRRPGAAARGGGTRNRRSRAALRHVLGHRLRRRRRPDVRERRQHRLAAHRLAGQLHAHDQLGRRHEHRDVRPQARLEPGVVEVRARVGRTARRRKSQTRQTHIVNGRYAWHIDGDGEPVAVPPELAELYQLDLWLNPAGLHQGGAPARRESRRVLALGAARERPRRQRRRARESARRRDHGARQVPRRRDDQLAATSSRASRRRSASRRSATSTSSTSRRTSSASAT